MKEFRVVEHRIECWYTVYEIPELNVKGAGHEGLIQALANRLEEALLALATKGEKA